MSTKVKRVVGGVAAVALVLVLLAAWQLGLLTPEPDEVSLAETVATTVEASGEPVDEDGTRPTPEESEVESGDQEPAGVASATAEPAESAAASTDTTSGPTSSEASALDGEWQLAAGAGTFAGYRADGATGEAVGRTSAVTGTLIVQENSVTTVDLTVDMTQLTSDSRVRDDHLGDEGITWRTYPEASFSLSEPIQLPDDVVADEELPFAATGVLTVREVPQQVKVELDAALVEGQLIVVGSTPISLDDFGAGIGGVSDEATMEFSLVFARG